MHPAVPRDFGSCSLRTSCTSEGTVAGHGVERIGYGNDITLERHFVPAQSERIPRAVKPFVVLFNGCARTSGVASRSCFPIAGCCVISSRSGGVSDSEVRRRLVGKTTLPRSCRYAASPSRAHLLQQKLYSAHMFSERERLASTLTITTCFLRRPKGSGLILCNRAVSRERNIRCLKRLLSWTML